MLFGQKKERSSRVFSGVCFAFFFVALFWPTICQARQAAVGSPLDPDVPYLQGKANDSYQIFWTDSTSALKSAKACVETLQKNGMGQVIKSVWGDLWKWGWALACHETGGQYARMENDTEGYAYFKGTCTFQITFTDEKNLLRFSQIMNVSPGEVNQKIRYDKEFCARSGLYVFKGYGLAVFKTIPKALCAFGANVHLQQALSNPKGRCAMGDEMAIVRAWVMFAAGEGPDPRVSGVATGENEVFSLQEGNRGYGNSYIEVPELGKIVQLNCHSFDMKTPGRLALATKAFRNAMLLGVEDETRNVIKAQSDPDTTPKHGYRGHFLSRYCIDFIETIQQFYQKLRQLLTLSGLKEFIIQLVTEIVVAFLNKVCQYLIEGLETVLEMICLPLPDISLPSLGLPEIPSKSCDGISLNDIITLKTTEAVSIEDILNSETAGEIMPIDPVPTIRPASPGPIYDWIIKGPVKDITGGL